MLCYLSYVRFDGGKVFFSSSIGSVSHIKKNAAQSVEGSQD